MFTREGWAIAIAASAFGFLAFSWAGWPAALIGIPVGFAAFTLFARRFG